MGTVIPVRRARGGDAARAAWARSKSANEDLIAFARGHSGAVATIHQAVLAALEADDLDALVRGRHAGVAGDARARLRGDGLGGRRQGIPDRCRRRQPVEPRIVDARDRGRSSEVALRSVERGHPLFGTAAGYVRAEALVALEAEAPFPAACCCSASARRQPRRVGHGSAIVAVPWQPRSALCSAGG